METLQRTANRGSISTGYDIDNSLKLEADNSEYLERDPSSAGNRKLFTTSMWVKRTEIGQASTIFGVQPASSGSDANTFQFGFTSGDKFQCGLQTFYALQSNRLFRDTSAWYHIVVAVDTTQSTAANRIKLYVNGVQETSFSIQATITQDSDLGINFTEPHRIGTLLSNSWYFSGYIAEMNHIDGQTLTPTDFGEFDSDTGIWKPKAYAGSYGTNGFYLDFESSGSLGADSSGNSNNFTLNNITSADQASDSPTNNFCTLNPLMTNAGSTNYLTVTEGGTKGVNAAAAYKISNSSIGLSSGKWYWEVKATDVNGVTAIGVTMPNYWDADYTLQGCIYYAQGPQRYNNASASSFGSGYSDGDIISFALDMDATPPTMEVYKNNSSEGNLMAGLSINGTGGAFLPEKKDFYFPKIVGYNANTFECNFGGYTSFSISSAESDANGYGNFEYAPPSGYYAICTKNLAEYG